MAASGYCLIMLGALAFVNISLAEPLCTTLKSGMETSHKTDLSVKIAPPSVQKAVLRVEKACPKPVGLLVKVCDEDAYPSVDQATDALVVISRWSDLQSNATIEISLYCLLMK